MMDSIYITWAAMWDRFFRQRANIGITRSCMRWYVRKNYLTWVKTTEILIWCARKRKPLLEPRWAQPKTSIKPNDESFISGSTMSLRQSLLLFIIFLTTCNSILSSNIIGKLRQNKDCYTLINTNKPSTVLPAKSDSEVIFVYNY